MAEIVIAATADGRFGPNVAARVAQAKLDELKPLRDAAKGQERAKLNAHMKALRTMLRFAKTRRGYVG